MAAVGDVEGRLDAGDAAADDQCSLRDRDGDRDELFVLLDPLDEHGDDLGRLGRRLFFVLVDPGAVLADVGHLAEEGVEARTLGGIAEGLLVHPRGAGGDDDPVKVLLGDRLLQQVLPRVGAHVFVVGGIGDTGDAACLLCYPFHVDRARDVLAAVTDKYADSGHIKPSGLKAKGQGLRVLTFCLEPLAISRFREVVFLSTTAPG